MNKLEIAELVNQLASNIDEADQFMCHIPEILKHCDKKFLIDLGKKLATTIEENRELHRECQVDTNEEIDMLIRLIRKQRI